MGDRPQGLVGLHRVGLPDAHEDEVVEDAFGRQRDVHDLGEVHLEDVSSLQGGFELE